MYLEINIQTDPSPDRLAKNSTQKELAMNRSKYSNDFLRYSLSTKGSKASIFTLSTFNLFPFS